MTALISPQELHDSLDDEQTVILDATFVLPDSQLDPHEGFKDAHIPGARFFDIEAVADHNTDLPHMLPSKDSFAEAVAQLGISNDTRVVMYGQDSIAMGPARVWWMFRVFGHNNVQVLNGSLKNWKNRDYPAESGSEPEAHKGRFTPDFRPELVAGRIGILASLEGHSWTVYDARPADRFSGDSPEPRPGMRSGHIPGSVNLPAGGFITPETGGFKKMDEIKNMLADYDFDQKPAVMSCGSGITACVPALALYEAFGKEVAIYDGSWSEWGQDNLDTPVEKTKTA